MHSEWDVGGDPEGNIVMQGCLVQKGGNIIIRLFILAFPFFFHKKKGGLPNSKFSQNGV
jgi:hypothetical protein